MAKGSREAIRADDEAVGAAEVRELKRQVRELQRVLGKKVIENELLRDAVRIAREKQLIQLPSLLPPDDIP
jgi:transposase